VSGGQQIVNRFSVAETNPWWPPRFFCGCILCVLIWGNSVVDRALRTVPRMMYHLDVDYWILIVVDNISRPVARFTTLAMIVILLNLTVHSLPGDMRIVIPQTIISAELEEPILVNQETLAEMLCPVSRRILFAFWSSTIALVLMKLRDAPLPLGSSKFRLYPIEQRDREATDVSKASLESAPILHLYNYDREIEMPSPTKGESGILEWCFDSPARIDEYTWATPQHGPPERDPVFWRLEVVPPPPQEGSCRWRCIHETDRCFPELVPTERGALLKTRFKLPSGRVPAKATSWLGIYYRTLQNPHEDRDRFAHTLFFKKVMLPLLAVLGIFPWLPVFNIQPSSIIGMTSIGGVAAGVALSLAKSEVLENIFAGMLLSAQGNIIQGDELEVQFQVGNSLQKQPGRMARIGSAYVELWDAEGQLVHVPNRKVLGSIMKVKVPAEAQNVGLNAFPRQASGDD